MDSPDLAPGYRICAPVAPRKGKTKVQPIYCNRVRPLTKFKLITDKTTGRSYRIHQCQKCESETKKLYYERDKPHYIERNARWKERNPELVARYRQIELERRAEKRQDPRNCEERRAYLEDYYQRNKYRIALQRAMRRAEQRANIPVEVILPYIQEAQRQIAAANMGGIAGGHLGAYDDLRAGDGVQTPLMLLALRTGASIHTLRDATDPGRRGKVKSVSLETVDRVVLFLGVPIEQVTDRAREWAQQTGEPWPLDYLPKDRGRKEITSNGRLRKRIRDLQAEIERQQLAQEQLAA